MQRYGNNLEPASRSRFFIKKSNIFVESKMKNRDFDNHVFHLRTNSCRWLSEGATGRRDKNCGGLQPRAERSAILGGYAVEMKWDALPQHKAGTLPWAVRFWAFSLIFFFMGRGGWLENQASKT